MYRILPFFILILIFSIVFPAKAQAISDPRGVANNRFGIHIIDENDLNDAAKVLNSQGGDWGYVKIVIPETERQIGKWQEVFDRMRQLHIIPIVRLATHVEHGYWVKPRTEDIGSWVDFLSSLNWVTQNRYVVIFNEPNHANEWGGQVNPEEYAWYLKEFSRRLKEKSSDFFILPAGLDASAPNGSQTLDEAAFIGRMAAKEPDVFTFIDGWSSHSYPNPGFAGSPSAAGKGTVRTYQWERELLKKYSAADKPIFILETGWRHSEGKNFQSGYPNPAQVGSYFKTAFENAWKDEQIAAVVPFLLNYQDSPFDHFSWKRIGNNGFNEIYQAVSEISKTAGIPKQYHSAKIINSTIAEKLVSQSTYTFEVELENTGQSILGSTEGWKLEIVGLDPSLNIDMSPIANTVPFHRTRVKVQVTTGGMLKQYGYSLVLKHQDETIFSQVGQFVLVPPPSLLLYAKTWFNKLANDQDYKLLVYGEKQQLLYEIPQVDFVLGFANIENLHNVVPNRTYRLVLMRPYYLPRQSSITIGETKTGVSFPMLLPLDASNDGKLSPADTWAFLVTPVASMKRLLAL